MVAIGLSSARRRTQLRTAPMAVLIVAAAATIGALSVLQPALAWVIALGIVGTVAIVDRPATGGLVLAVAVPVSSGFAEGTIVPTLRPSEAMIAGIACIVLLLPLRGALRWNTLDVVVGLYVGASLLLAGLHALDDGTLFAERLLVIAPLQFLLLYRVVAVTLRDAEQRETAVRAMLLISIPVSVIAVLQQLDIGPTRDLIFDLTRSDVFDTWGYEHHPRATSVFPSWHPLAGYLVVVMVLACARLTTSGRRLRQQAETLTVLLFASAALALSLTFTAIFAVALGVVVVLRRQRSLALAWWAIALAVLTLTAFGSSLTERVEQQWAEGADGGIVPQTIEYRFEVWTDEYVPIIEDYWLVGFGAGLPPNVDWQHTESGFLSLLLRGGVPLVALGIGLILVSHRHGDRLVERSTGNDRAIGLTAVAVAIALIPMNLVWPYLTNSGMSQALFVVLGLVRAASGEVDRSPPVAQGSTAGVALSPGR